MKSAEQRIAEALDFLTRYNGELDHRMISPNGDDFNAVVETMRAMLQDGADAPDVRITPVGR